MTYCRMSHVKCSRWFEFKTQKGSYEGLLIIRADVRVKDFHGGECSQCAILGYNTLKKERETYGHFTSSFIEVL